MGREARRKGSPQWELRVVTPHPHPLHQNHLTEHLHMAQHHAMLGAERGQGARAEEDGTLQQPDAVCRPCLDPDLSQSKVTRGLGVSEIYEH